jgi:hypothetical protein
MFWLIVGVLGVILLGFAYTAQKWQQKADEARREADFWERAYMEKAANLEGLRAVIKEVATDQDDAVVRVWKAGQS